MSDIMTTFTSAFGEIFLNSIHLSLMKMSVATLAKSQFGNGRIHPILSPCPVIFNKPNRITNSNNATCHQGY